MGWVDTDMVSGERKGVQGFKGLFFQGSKHTVTQKASITEIRRRSRRWGLPHIVTPSRHVENRPFLLLNPAPLEQERLLANPE